MKRVANLFLIALMMLAFVPIQKIQAGTPAPELIEMSLNKSSAVANGSDSIQVSIRLFRYQCTSPKLTIGGPAYAMTYSLTEAQSLCNTFTGSSAVTGKVTVDGPIAVSNPYLQLLVDGSLRNPDNSTYVDTGIAYFTVKSTVAGGKTVVAKSSGANWPGWSGHDTLTLTFTAPSSTSSSAATTTTAKTTTAAAPTAAQPTKPAVPSVVDATIGDQKTEIKTGESPSFIFNEEKGVTFSGKTIPNGKVTLYFQSEPFSDTTTADANGIWTYILKRDLGEGEHSLETTVTDPTNNLTSDKSPAAKFALNYEKKSDTAPTETVAATKNKNLLWYYVGGALILLAAAGAGVFFYLRKKKKPAVVKEETKE